jgi:hypothetical protein
VNIDMISERGPVSALSACPLAAAARSAIAGPRLTAPIHSGLVAGVRPQAAAAVKPFMVVDAPFGTGLRTSLVADGRYGVVTPAPQLDQFVPSDPGALTRRPPA